MGCLDTYVVSATFFVEVFEECIAPPFTSKIVKYILTTHPKFRYLREFVSVKKFLKPLIITPLFKGDKPLYSTYKHNGNYSVITLKPNETYVFRLGLATSNYEVIRELYEIDGGFVTTYGKFHITPGTFEVNSINSLGLSFEKFFRINFLTPTLLTNKLMVPPPLFTKASKVPEKHRLIPSPSYIFNYLIRLWNSLVPNNLKLPKPGADLWGAYRFGRISDIVVNEVDYRFKTVTAIYGKDESGKLRKVRGFVGWVIYELNYPKLKPIYSKLLALANYLGLGRSRSIGFGYVKTEPADKQKTSKNT